MFRVSLAVLTGLLTAFLATGSASAGDAKTIRIEPRAFYGATVSLESGVRVFRPVPATSHMIINPNRTPLNLSIKDVTKRVYQKSQHHYHGSPNASGGRYGVGGYYLPGFKKSRARRAGPRGRGRRNPGPMSRR